MHHLEQLRYAAVTAIVDVWDDINIDATVREHDVLIRWVDGPPIRSVGRALVPVRSSELVELRRRVSLLGIARWALRNQPHSGAPTLGAWHLVRDTEDLGPPAEASIDATLEDATELLVDDLEHRAEREPSMSDGLHERWECDAAAIAAALVGQ